METTEQHEVKQDDIEKKENENNTIDLSKYEQNLQNDVETDSETEKLKSILDKQNDFITTLKAEIKSLKDLNLKLALTQGAGEQPQNAIDTLNSVFTRSNS